MARCTFLGRVHPERACVSGVDLPVGLAIPALAFDGNARVQIYASQIQVTVEGDPVDDLPTLRNAAQNLMAVALDTLSWAFGRAYSIEVTSLTADNADLTVFGVDFGPIESKRASQQPLDVGAVTRRYSRSQSSLAPSATSGRHFGSRSIRRSIASGLSSVSVRTSTRRMLRRRSVEATSSRPQHLPPVPRRGEAVRRP